MNKIKHHLEEARITRNTARKIVDADWSYIKLLLEPQQIAHWAREEADKISDKAQDFYEDNPETVKKAGLGAAVLAALWAGIAVARASKKHKVEQAEQDMQNVERDIAVANDEMHKALGDSDR